MAQTSVLTKPAAMPDTVWESLLGYLVTQRDRGRDATIRRVWWASQGQRDGMATPLRPGYWRAGLLLNDVNVKVYYNPWRGHWCRA